MVTSGYRYTLDLFRKDGSRIGQAAIDVDWTTAEEWVRFEALRRGRRSAMDPGTTTTIDPVWHETIGAPYISGFRVSLCDGAPAAEAGELTTAHLQALARAATTLFVERGTLAAGERIVYLAAAFPAREEPPNGSALAFDAEEVSVPLPLPEASLADVSNDAVFAGDSSAEDVPVFVPEGILDETAFLARQVEGKETGGILIGHVHRDHDSGDLFVRVTAQIPARHTEASATRLTFTPETWTDVRAALALRRRDEIMVGWWHSHPIRHWCKDCPPERQAVCGLARGFFSEDDHALHRTVFSRAYCIALVVNDGAGDPTFSLFGWRRGLVASRGFGILGASRPAAAFENHGSQVEGESCSRPELVSSTSTS